tara:strand:+ start:2590 stop:3438 length:849 start_codon:yes stop_codon:yes gene_type:complete
MSYGNISRAEGIKYEDVVSEQFNMILGELRFEVLEDKKKCIDIFNGKTTTKSDMTDIVTGNGYSIKNPKTSSGSIQMFICSKEKMIRKLDQIEPIPALARMYCDLFLGFKSKQEMRQACLSVGINYEKLNFNEEKRRIRCRHDSIPLEYQNSFRQYINNKKIRSAICDMVFSKGFCLNKENHADYMIWSDSSIAGKNSIENMTACSIEKLKDNIINNEWRIRESNTVWEMGPLTLQMKGSGAKNSQSYHSPQFNASLNDLKKCATDDIFINGNITKLITALL